MRPFVEFGKCLLLFCLGGFCCLADGTAAEAGDGSGQVGAGGQNNFFLPGLTQAAPEYRARVWQTDEGLPNNRVQAISQTPDGYLWVGTHDGLARFDGVQFTTFNGANTPELKNSSITALCPDAHGALWIGTQSGGLARLRQGWFSLFTVKDGLAGDNIRALLNNQDGTLWIGTTRGLSRYQDGVFHKYALGGGGLAAGVTALCADGPDAVWVAMGKELFRVRQDAVETFPKVEGLSGLFIRALWLEGDQHLWIGTDHGVLECASSASSLSGSYTTSQGLADNLVSAVHRDRQNRLWIGTDSGLNCLDAGRLQTTLNEHGLPLDKVNTLFEDTYGDIWVGSREGLIRLTRKVFAVVTRRQWLTHNHVSSVLEDQRKRLWVGTWGGGIDVVDGGTVKVFGTTNQLGTDTIRALCQSHDGSIWAGADNDGGLFRISDEGVTHYGARQGLLDQTVSALHEDERTNLWIGSPSGLWRWQRGVFTVEPATRGRAIWAICEDAAGRLWFGGDAGLMCRRNDAIENLSGQGVFPRTSVCALLAGDDSSVWAGTRDNGLWRGRNGRWERFGPEEGLYSSEILGMAEDQGWLWMTSTKGIFRVRTQDLEGLAADRKQAVPCFVYGKSDGLESIVCGNWSAPTVWKTAGDQICFATTIGLAVTDAKEARADLSSPSVYIEQIEADEKPVSWSGDSLTVPPSRGELDIHYTALDLRAPEKCRFKYRLDGVDAGWVDADTHRTAHYSGLGPGRWMFHVLACNQDGVWSQTGASLLVNLRPHFWQTWWFRALALVALAGVAGASARFVTQRKMQRQLELAERRHAVERERGRIAKDIHDELGSSLTRIMLLGQRAESDLAASKEVGPHLKKIVNFSRSTIQAMDEIVWAVNPRNDTLDGLISYLNEYAAQFFQDAAIRCRLQMPVTSDVWLRSELRHDLFLAFKEALNNVLKHSMATEVHVQVFQEGSTVSIIIDDNGRGFDLSEKNGRQGNGLQNIRRRMDAVGGQMEVTTAPGHGTQLRLAVRVSTGGTVG